MLGQELRGGDEERAGQAGVGMRAGPGQRKPAKAVRQGLGGPAETLPGPGGLGERPVWVEGDIFACGVDLAGGFPVPADGGVGQPGLGPPANIQRGAR